MRAWRDLLGGLILWAVHFFALYIIASALPGARVAPGLVLATTLLLLVANLWFAARTIRALGAASDATLRWLSGLSLMGYALSAIVIVYQGLPALLLSKTATLT